MESLFWRIYRRAHNKTYYYDAQNAHDLRVKMIKDGIYQKGSIVHIRFNGHGGLIGRSTYLDFIKDLRYLMSNRGGVYLDGCRTCDSTNPNNWTVNMSKEVSNVFFSGNTENIAGLSIHRIPNKHLDGGKKVTYFNGKIVK